MIDLKKYKVPAKKNVKLKDYSTGYKGPLTKKEVYDYLLPANQQAMRDWQERLYADNKMSLLIVLQAMDAAGKDGVIKHVFTAMNPQGVKVTPFKVPTSLEEDHDYLWRINKALPARGDIGIFNRSHYEEVLVTRVHDLLEHSQIPAHLIDENIWKRRFEEIRNYEEYLSNNGTKILKFFLHVSKDEQKERLLSRIDRPEKNWKFSSSDVSEREHWDDYQVAYEELLCATSTKQCPWFVIPADRKWYTRYVISEIVVRTFHEMDPRFPDLAPEEVEKLGHWRDVLLEGK